MRHLKQKRKKDFRRAGGRSGRGPGPRLVREEEGGLIVSLIIKAAVVAVVVLLVLDSISVINAYKSSDNGTDGAANAALTEWKASKSDYAARDAAVSYCQSQGLTFEDFQVLSDPEHGYQVTCSKDAGTRLFGHIPGLSKMTHQSVSNRAFGL